MFQGQGHEVEPAKETEQHGPVTRKRIKNHRRPLQKVCEEWESDQVYEKLQINSGVSKAEADEQISSLSGKVVLKLPKKEAAPWNPS